MARLRGGNFLAFKIFNAINTGTGACTNVQEALIDLHQHSKISDGIREGLSTAFLSFKHGGSDGHGHIQLAVGIELQVTNSATSDLHIPVDIAVLFKGLSPSGSDSIVNAANASGTDGIGDLLMSFAIALILIRGGLVATSGKTQLSSPFCC